MDLRNGGKAAIERMLEAYGVMTKQALCEQLGISSSTLANRYLRDTFPADYIIQCALETGVSLKWLVTGEGSKIPNTQHFSSLKELPFYTLKNGVLMEDDVLILDDKLLPNNSYKLHVISDANKIHFVDCSKNIFDDGIWLISIDESLSFRKIYRMPAGQVKIENSQTSFISSMNDISLRGCAVSTINPQ